MSRKPVREGQHREGNAARRRMEFEVVLRNVRERREAFIARLQRHVVTAPDGAGCYEYRAAGDGRGYSKISFRHRGRHVVISAHRVFWILMSGAQIPLGMEVDHPCCNRPCVRHLRLLPFAVNARTKGDHVGIPF